MWRMTSLDCFSDAGASHTAKSPLQNSVTVSVITFCEIKIRPILLNTNNTALIQSGGWGLVKPHNCPQIWRSKKNSNSTQFIELYFGVSEQIKPLQPIGQAAEFKLESKQVIWQSLLKAIREDNRRIWLQNQWPSSWGSALAQLGRVGLASTNTGCCLVGGSR